MMHVPLIVRQPGRIAEGRTSDILASNYDLLPTILDDLGLADQMPDPRASPGRDFAAVFRGEPLAWENVVYYEIGPPAPSAPTAGNTSCAFPTGRSSCTT